MPFVREPPENFHVYIDASKDQEIVTSNSSMLTELYSFEEPEEKRKKKRGCIKSCSSTSAMFLLDNFAPSANEVEDIEIIERKDDCLGIHLWQRSAFYDKTKIDMNAWQLRWFKFSYNKILSLPQRRETEPDDDVYMLPLITNFDKDDRRLLIKVTMTNEEESKFYPFGYQMLHFHWNLTLTLLRWISSGLSCTNGCNLCSSSTKV